MGAVFAISKSATDFPDFLIAVSAGVSVLVSNSVGGSFFHSCFLFFFPGLLFGSCILLARSLMALFSMGISSLVVSVQLLSLG